MTMRWVAGAFGVGLLLLGTQVASAQDTTFKFYWKDGFRADSADGNFKMKLGGRMQYDAGFFEADPGLEAANGDFDNGTELRRARLEVEATAYERFIFKTQYDFADGDANIKDMYMGIEALPVLGTLRIGQFKEAFSIDELTSSKYDEFIEQALNTIFAPSRNPGIGFHSPALNERMTYAFGVFRDGDDFGNSGAAETWAVTGRVTGLPWYAAEDQLLHVGAAFTYRQPDDTVRIRQRPSAHLAPRVVDTGAFVSDGYWAFNPEASFLYGPFNLQGEYTLASYDASASGDPDFSGYYVQASYWLTGEHRSYKTAEAEFARVKPNVNFLQAGGLGAWQVTARYASLDLNDALVAGGETSDFTAGLNWQWNPNMRVMFNYVYSDTKTEGDANLFLTRFQVDF